MASIRQVIQDVMGRQGVIASQRLSRKVEADPTQVRTVTFLALGGH